MTESHETGMSLVEVLAATTVVALALLAIATMYLSALSFSAHSGEYSTAVNLVQERVEFLRNQAYGSPDLAAGTTTEVLGASFEGYERVTQIQDDTPRDDVKLVSVSVSMLEPAGSNTPPPLFTNRSMMYVGVAT